MSGIDPGQKIVPRSTRYGTIAPDYIPRSLEAAEDINLSLAAGGHEFTSRRISSRGWRMPPCVHAVVQQCQSRRADFGTI
jgi:hypothetical protein